MADEKLQKAAQNIRDALGNLPKEFERVQVDEDDDSRPIFGWKKHLAEVLAGDVVLVARSVPPEKRDQITKDLLKGSSPWAADREVACQSRCLWNLLEKAGFGGLSATKPPPAEPAAVMVDQVPPTPKE